MVGVLIVWAFVVFVALYIAYSNLNEKYRDLILKKILPHAYEKTIAERERVREEKIKQQQKDEEEIARNNELIAASAYRKLQKSYSYKSFFEQTEKYDSFHPQTKLKIPTQIKWVPLKNLTEARISNSQGQIDIDDVAKFRTTIGHLLIDRLERRLAALKSMDIKNSYPVSIPKIRETLVGPLPPREADLSNINELNTFKLTKEQSTLLVQKFSNDFRKIEKKYGSALERWESAKQQEIERLQEIQKLWEEHKEIWEKDVEEEILTLRLLKHEIKTCKDPEVVTSKILRTLSVPEWFGSDFTVRYDLETKILIVEHEYLNIENASFFKKVQLKNNEATKPLNKSEEKDVKSVFYSLTTLHLASVLAMQLPPDVVETIVINGWTDYRSKSTGELKRAYCVSLIAKNDQLRSIDLQYADPNAAFTALKGIVSRSVELVPIAPTLRVDKFDSRFVDAKEVLGNLSTGENLASMDWEDFEHLCRELFERVFASAGATVSVTQASRDQGVDAIIFDPDPIRGGRIVIQAKRYVNTVDVSAVRDLWGTVQHEGAMKGILVTTSQYGPDSFEFAKGKPITLIGGGELLGLLEQHGYKFRIDLEEARRIQKETGIPSFKKRGKTTDR